MNLKPKKPQAPSEPPSGKPDNWTGPWGRINPTSAGCEVVRFCQRPDRTQEQTHSYPYRVISSWHWRNGGAEGELKIEAGADLVTVRGRGLDRIVEALDCGTLEILCETPDEEGAIWISTITVEGMPFNSNRG